MTQKTKTIIVVAIILMATVIVGTYLLQKNIPVANAPQEALNSVQITQQPAENMGAQEAKKVTFPKEISGRVVGMTSATWIVEQPTGAREIGINIKTPVFKMEGSVKKAMTVFDVKAGNEIIAQLNIETGEVLEAFITK
ncbi:MAG: hypothetical protein HGA36_02525 [Candidatus Moranbacteria bacterium]|nr:hypothetical protein [Candidatus Moranbacteria bacterium]